MKTEIKDIKFGRCHRHDDGKIHRDSGKFVDTTFHKNDITPHWQRYGKDGSLHAEIDGAIGGEWLQFDITESAEKSSKRVMFNLNRDQVCRLRDLCNLILEEKSVDDLSLSDLDELRSRFA